MTTTAPTSRPISPPAAIGMGVAMIAMSFVLTVMLLFPFLIVAAVLLRLTGNDVSGEAAVGYLIAVVLTWLVYWSLVFGVARHYRTPHMYTVAVVAAIAGPVLQYVALETW